MGAPDSVATHLFKDLQPTFPHFYRYCCSKGPGIVMKTNAIHFNILTIKKNPLSTSYFILLIPRGVIISSIRFPLTNILEISVYIEGDSTDQSFGDNNYLLA